MENNEPSIKNMCKDYKEYRINESKKVANMSNEEQVEYYLNKQTEAQNLAKSLNIKTVDFGKRGNK